MSKTNPTDGGDDPPDYVQRLEAIERVFERGTPNRAAKVLKRWFDGSETSDGIEGTTLFRRDEKDWCRDCGAFAHLYVWGGPLPPNICAECSMSRFKNGGRNLRSAADPDSSGPDHRRHRRRRGR